MAGRCYSSIQGLAMRATRIDGCGTPVTGGATDVVTSDGFVSIGLAAQIEEGTDYTQKNASGKLCVSEKGASALTRYAAAISFCQVDVQLYELVAGVRMVTDFGGDAVGFAVDENLSDGAGWGLEVWTKVPPTPDAPCDPAGTGTYLYWLLPWLVDGRLGDFTIEDSTATFTVSANTRKNNVWGVGPYDVVPINVGGTAGPLDTPGILPTEHLYQRLTTIEPPTVDCGYAA